MHVRIRLGKWRKTVLKTSPCPDCRKITHVHPTTPRTRPSLSLPPPQPTYVASPAPSSPPSRVHLAPDPPPFTPPSSRHLPSVPPPHLVIPPPCSPHPPRPAAHLATTASRASAAAVSASACCTAAADGRPGGSRTTAPPPPGSRRRRSSLRRLANQLPTDCAPRRGSAGHSRAPSLSRAARGANQYRPGLPGSARYSSQMAERRSL